MNPRLIACRPHGCYRLLLKYADGYSGSVYLGSVLEIGPFRALRDPRMFNTARVDDETGNVWWPQTGVHLDPDILRQDILARGAGKVEAPGADPAFKKFMARAVSAKDGPPEPYLAAERARLEKNARLSMAGRAAWARRRRRKGKAP